MREILFRGKRLDNKELVHGMLCQYHKCISSKITLNDYGAYDSEMAYCVIPETVGQFTGLYDKNGTKIFEGDIISAKEKFANNEIYKFEVMFGECGNDDDGFMGFYFQKKNIVLSDLLLRKDPLFWIKIYNCEIIGNIFDNPELLEDK